MNKEILIDKGWVLKRQYYDTYSFEKGDVWIDDGGGAFLEFNVNDFNLIITPTDEGFNQDGPKISIKFNGYCETEQEYDFIYKMLRLKI